MAGRSGRREKNGKSGGWCLIQASDLSAGLKAANGGDPEGNHRRRAGDAEILRLALLPGREGCPAARR